MLDDIDSDRSTTKVPFEHDFELVRGRLTEASSQPWSRGSRTRLSGSAVSVALTVVALVAVFVAGCSQPAVTVSFGPEESLIETAGPISLLAPPAIEVVGLVVDAGITGSRDSYTLADGRVLNFDTSERRFLNTMGAELLIAGTDAQGPFYALYSRQGGLPDDCYVENALGTDRGLYIELRGVLFRKSPAFVPDQFVGLHSPYPLATRFCFNLEGQITTTVAP